MAANAGLTIVVVVDDAHYSDPALVSFLRQLMQMEAGSLLIAVSVWPSAMRQRSEGNPGSIGGLLDSTAALLSGRVTRIPLKKLDRSDAASLLLEAAPLTRPELLERFCDVIDGNPLLLRLYLDLDVIKRDIRDGALDTDPAVFGRLPSDAKHVWQQLWRQLPDTTRFALAVVSMQGPEFHPGFLRRAAADLGNFDAARNDLAGAAGTQGWVAAHVADLGSFTERLRYEVAHENQVDLLDQGQMAVVRKALVAHALETKASPGWSQLPVATRRAILRSHLGAAQEEPELSSTRDQADSALRLSVLEEEECGDAGAALDAARQAAEFAGQAGSPEMVVMCQTRLGLLERGQGNRAAAFEAINEAEVASKQLGVKSEVAAVLQEEVTDLAIAASDTASDSDVASESQSWTAWMQRDVPDLHSQSLASLAELAHEVARAEGPLTQGRLYDCWRRRAARSSPAKPCEIGSIGRSARAFAAGS